MDSLIERLREWADLPAHLRLLGSVEGIFDQENRHKSGKKSVDYLASWLSMLRPFAFATKDDSWGEMEKLLCIVMRNYIKVRRDAGLAATELERLTAENARLRGLIEPTEANVLKIALAMRSEGERDEPMEEWELELATAALNALNPET